MGKVWGFLNIRGCLCYWLNSVYQIRAYSIIKLRYSLQQTSPSSILICRSSEVVCMKLQSVYYTLSRHILQRPGQSRHAKLSEDKRSNTSFCFISNTGIASMEIFRNGHKDVLLKY